MVVQRRTKEARARSPETAGICVRVCDGKSGEKGDEDNAHNNIQQREAQEVTKKNGKWTAAAAKNNRPREGHRDDNNGVV